MTLEPAEIVDAGCESAASGGIRRRIRRVGPFGSRRIPSDRLRFRASAPRDPTDPGSARGGAPAPVFDPASVREFRFLGHGWSPATGAVELRYALDDRRFTETFRFPAADPGIVAARGPAIARAVRLLHLVAGVSYYKAAVPHEIAVDGPAPAPATARALELLWTGGLGEFAWHNDLPWIGSGIRFPAAGDAPPPAPPAGLSPRSLVPVGGGRTRRWRSPPWPGPARTSWRSRWAASPRPTRPPPRRACRSSTSSADWTRRSSN